MVDNNIHSFPNPYFRTLEQNTLLEREVIMQLWDTNLWRKARCRVTSKFITIIETYRQSQLVVNQWDNFVLKNGKIYVMSGESQIDCETYFREENFKFLKGLSFFSTKSDSVWTSISESKNRVDAILARSGWRVIDGDQE